MKKTDPAYFHPMDETLGTHGINCYGVIKYFKNGSISRGSKNKEGYIRTCIHIKGTRRHRRFLIHRLVAKYFVKNPNNYPIVMHLDDDKTNNFYKNLKWGTHLLNSRSASRNGLLKSGKETKVYVFNQYGKIKKVIPRIMDALSEMGIGRTMFRLEMRNKGYRRVDQRFYTTNQYFKP